MSKGLKFVMGDTDGLKFCKQDMSPISKEELEKLTEEINAMLPELITLEDDGYFERIAMVKTKNYVTEENGEIKIKGSGLIGQKKEPAMLEMIKEICNSILYGINYDELQEIYIRYITEAVNVKDITRWCQKKTITKAVLDCETNPSARLQERKLYNVMQGKGLFEGDKIYIFDYLHGEKEKIVKGEVVTDKNGIPKMVEDIRLKCAEDWDNNTYDPKLVGRVWATMSIFDTVIDIKQFTKYHNKGNLPKLVALKD
jgi:DNA polymerase elongation subunit (family B)